MRTIEELDNELVQIQEKINALALHRQRLLGYKQALEELQQTPDVKTENASPESTGSG